MKLVRWIRANLLATVLLAAIFGSLVVAEYDDRQNSREARDANVASCVRANARSALTSAYQARTADARRATGDKDVADDYDAFALGTAYFLARPDGVKDPAQIIEVEKVEDAMGRPRYALTKRSQALVQEGCEDSF